jgi:hypothetical protein
MAHSSDPADMLAFVSQHNPSKSRVFALLRSSGHPSGFVELEAVATVSESGRSDELCAALNQFIYDKDEAIGFHARLRALLVDEPESVNAAIRQLLDRIKRSGQASKDSPLRGISPFGSFPLSACPPGGCPTCGQCVNSCKACAVCAEYDEGCECYVPMPPRTASLIHAAAEVLSDHVHDIADEVLLTVPLRPHEDLWPVPRSARWQSQDFYRRFAHAFEDVARDIDEGELPQPHNMAEEIALHLVLDFASDIASDKEGEFELWTGGMPESRFDFDFDGLQDILYQDKDYELAYLDSRSDIAKPGDLENWFEDFNQLGSRDRSRGFNR